MKISYYKDGLVNIQDIWMSWNAICYILMWPVYTELNQRLIDIANNQLRRFPAQQNLLEIELKVRSIVDNYQVGLNFDMSAPIASDVITNFDDEGDI